MSPKVKVPTDFILFGERNPDVGQFGFSGYNEATQKGLGLSVHGIDVSNYAHADGHVDSLKLTEAHRSDTNAEMVNRYFAGGASNWPNP